MATAFSAIVHIVLEAQETSQVSTKKFEFFS